MFSSSFRFHLPILLPFILCCLDFALSKTFLHMTDLTYDSLYQNGATSKTFCHSISPNEVGDCGLFGAPGASAYSNQKLIESLLFEIIHKMGCPDLILYSGGSLRHDTGRNDGVVSYDKWQREMSTAMQELRTPFESCPNMEIIYAIGNTDTFPEGRLPAGPTEILSNLTNLWNIPTDQVDNFNKYGSYYRKVNTSLYVISVNTLYWSSDNKNIQNPGCEDKNSIGSKLFDWIEQSVLQAVVRPAYASAFIVGHRYPLDAGQEASCYTRYKAMVNAYSDVLRGHFFGGSEYIDRFYLVPMIENEGEKVGIVNIAPAIQPYYNPAVRQYTYTDDRDVMLMDYVQWYADLQQANIDKKLNLVEEYSPLTAFGMDDLTVASWVLLNRQLDQEDSTIDDLWTQYKYVSSNIRKDSVPARYPYVAIIGMILFLASWIVMIYKCCRWPNITYAQELQYAEFKKSRSSYGS